MKVDHEPTIGPHETGMPTGSWIAPLLPSVSTATMAPTTIWTFGLIWNLDMSFSLRQCSPGRKSARPGERVPARRSWLGKFFDPLDQDVDVAEHVLKLSFHPILLVGAERVKNIADDEGLKLFNF